jgi:3,4-dihydroxy-2-butanone 4-phosphate synthase
MLDTIESALEDLKNGKLLIVVDDEEKMKGTLLLPPTM